MIFAPIGLYTSTGNLLPLLRPDLLQADRPENPSGQDASSAQPGGRSFEERRMRTLSTEIPQKERLEDSFEG